MEEVKTGIYLEVTKGTLGVGYTAKETEFRNFWMTLSQNDNIVQCVLLDSDFNPTAINQKFLAADFLSGRLKFIPEGEKRYQRLLRSLLENKSISQPKTDTDPQPAPEKKESENWWQAPEKEIKSGDLFKRDERPSSKPSLNPSANWWEPHDKEARTGDILKDSALAEKPLSPKKKPRSEKSLKKTWWDK